MKAPVRFRVLEYMTTVKRACPDDMMEALRTEYGTERHFTKKNFIDHAMCLKANGLLEDAGEELNGSGDLILFYSINEEGTKMVSKYMPKK